MSTEVTAAIWDITCPTPLEKLILIWIANSQPGFGGEDIVDLIKGRPALLRFTGHKITDCLKAIKSLQQKGVIFHHGGYVGIVPPTRR